MANLASPGRPKRRSRPTWHNQAVQNAVPGLTWSHEAPKTTFQSQLGTIRPSKMSDPTKQIQNFCKAAQSSGSTKQIQNFCKFNKKFVETKTPSSMDIDGSTLVY